MLEMILRIVVRTRMGCRESTHRRLVRVQKLGLMGDEHVRILTLRFGEVLQLGDNWFYEQTNPQRENG